MVGHGRIYPELGTSFIAFLHPHERRPMPTDQKMPVQKKPMTESERALLAIAGVMLVGLLGIGVYGLQAPSAGELFSRVSLGSLTPKTDSA